MADTHAPESMAVEYVHNTDHDWLAAIARKTRQYGKHPSEEKARLSLDSIRRMIRAWELARNA